MPSVVGRTISGLSVLVLALCLWGPAAAQADWTTYRGDPSRSGVDSSSVGSLPFAPAWSSQNLGGDIWGEPLVYDGLVIVATEANKIVALSEATGQVAWQASAGTPVASTMLPCGDIKPTVGITSTPVIDPVTDHVFVVADTLQGSRIQHELYAFDLSSGAAVPGFPVNVEPPGDVPADQLQRPGLALTGGQIIIGYGGNDGDCGTYHGWLVSVPETGGSPRTYEVDPKSSEGAIWGSGNAPAIDASGNVWISTGNGGAGSSYGYQESVLRLDPSMQLLDSWAPSNWAALDSGDVDLGSSEPVLLPNGPVFQIGKAGVGYLLSAGHLGGTNAPPVYSAPVCNGSWGGAVYSSGIIYVSCSDGLRALAVSGSSFSPVAAWQVSSAVNGPPIVAGDLVWATDWNHGTLYGLNLQTGKPVVRQSTPAMEHFATPSASDGKLFLATGPTVEAYTIASPAPSGTVTSPVPAPQCVLRVLSARVKVHHRKARRHHRHPPPPFGTVSLRITCDQAVQVSLTGTVTERLVGKGRHGKAKTRTVHLSRARAALMPSVARTLQMRLGPSVLTALKHHIRASGSFTATATDAAGATRARTRTRLRL
jgi:outer membrane protein assembly factor BamB